MLHIPLLLLSINPWPLVKLTETLAAIVQLFVSHIRSISHDFSNPKSDAVG